MRKAELLENSVMAIRRAHWKEVIGVTAEKGSSNKNRPTKASYRYISGSEGWTTSPVGQKGWDDAVPEGKTQSNDDNENEQNTFEDLAPFTPDDSCILTSPLCDQASVDKQGNEWGAL